MLACVCLYLTTGILGIFALLFANYWFRVRRSHYWKDRNVPSAAPIPFIGNYLNLLTGSTFFQVEHEQYKRFGRLFGGYEGFSPIIYVSDPDLVKDIMIKDFHVFSDRREFTAFDPILKLMVSTLVGDDWKRVRSVMTPAFSTGKLKKLVHLMNECSVSSAETFLNLADSGQGVEVKRLFGTFAMDVISSTVFGTKLDSANDPNNIFVQNVSKLTNNSFQWRFIVVGMLPRVASFFRLKPFDGEIIQFFVEVSKAVIARRRTDNTQRDDMLQLLLDAQKRNKNGELSFEDMEVTTDAGEEFAESYFQQYLKNKSISEEEFVAQCVLFFTAGYESTANTLAMFAYYMALNPQCQDKLMQEVDTIWQKYPNLNYEAATECKYLDAALAETLRMAPPGARLERQAKEDYKLGGTGIIVPKGMNVAVPVYGMHHDPEFFPNPYQFDPDRFLPENKSKIRPYTYLPFGSGPRHCMGMRLVQMEMKVCLLNVFKKVSFHTCKDTDIPLKFYGGSFGFLPKRVTLKIVKR